MPNKAPRCVEIQLRFIAAGEVDVKRLLHQR